MPVDEQEKQILVSAMHAMFNSTGGVFIFVTKEEKTYTVTDDEFFDGLENLKEFWFKEFYKQPKIKH